MKFYLLRLLTKIKLKKLIHGKCRNKDKIIESLKSSKIESNQHFKMTEIQSHMNELDKHIEAVEVEIIKRTPDTLMISHILLKLVLT